MFTIVGSEEIRFVADVPEFAVVSVEVALLVEVQRSRADATEDTELIARFIDGSVAVECFGDARCVSVLREFLRGDQTGVRARGEAHVAGSVGAGQLHDAHPVVAVGEVRELAVVGDAELHIVEVVDAAVGVVDLVDLWFERILHIDDDETLMTAGNVGIRPSDIDVAGFVQRERGSWRG